jgi:hypothetical protein
MRARPSRSWRPTGRAAMCSTRPRTSKSRRDLSSPG